MWWLTAAFALGVVEVLLLDVVVLMLIGGSLVGALVAALGGPVWLQFGLAALTSVTLVLTLRPWALEQFAKRVPLDSTGTAQARIGRVGEATSDISEHGGQIKLLGELWSARLPANAHGALPVGTQVLVTEIAGATAVVVPVDGWPWNQLDPPTKTEPRAEPDPPTQYPPTQSE